MKISIVIPYYRQMKNAEFFLKRCIDSIMSQTYEDYEIIITEKGTISQNTNAGLKRAKGDLIKILFMDDAFSHPDALKRIVEAFKGQWLITGSDNNPFPDWIDDIYAGNNKLGSPSALTIKNENVELFDESLVWMLDCDYYKRLYDKYGKPVILNGNEVRIGIHDGQATNNITDTRKQDEVNLLIKRYDKI
jgi:glycosyltransferase involved in cell wall biosynthesis